jgi:hypothetical protein
MLDHVVAPGAPGVVVLDTRGGDLALTTLVPNHPDLDFLACCHALSVLERLVV